MAISPVPSTVALELPLYKPMVRQEVVDSEAQRSKVPAGQDNMHQRRQAFL